MFIRIKSRKNSSGKIKKYAYLVRSKRRKGSKKPPKQRIISYLGKVIHLNNHQQSSTINIKKDLTATIKALLSELLISNGFEPNKDILTKQNIVIDLSKRTIKHLKTGQNLCLQVNEGFVANHTLKKILPYKPPETTEKWVGMDFAQKILASGLKPSNEAFLSLYAMVSNSFHRK
jgi:hypothetical protein